MKPARHSLVTLAVALAVTLGRSRGAYAEEPAPQPAPDAGAPETTRQEAPPLGAAGAPAVEQASGGQAGEQASQGGEAAADPVVVPASTAAARPAHARPVPLARSPRSPAPAPPAAAETPAAPAAAAEPARGTRITVPLDVEVHGRLYMGVAADERDDWTRRLDMTSARISVEARLPGVLTVLEADVASKTPIKDAFARLDGPFATRLQAGRFKAPFSARQLESSWKLPLVDRGLVNGYLVKDNELGGRRLGATAGVRPWSGRLELVGGVFVGERSAFGGQNKAQDLAARASAHPWKPFELGVTAYRAGSSDALVPVRQAASAYAQLSRGPLDATVEGFGGKLDAGTFTAGTALVGWTFKLGEARRLRVTPVAGAEVLELRGTTRGVGYSAIGGAVLAWTEGLKVKLQGERARRPGDEVPGNALAMQIATRF
ncbi:OprO/OprP family phosphate-selective porin [Anaeromyxobacter terrae]|uniref:OprO/OprP family phosphate-selective porin n=1 Tax=Anaeromyxobacter terrae TaxID=2925406 RepID=UPI001F59C28E|nr:OprO/OprP family phosphate-selective porin [Anaeromyxobacter sp. SG22]